MIDSVRLCWTCSRFAIWKIGLWGCPSPAWGIRSLVLNFQDRVWRYWQWQLRPSVVILPMLAVAFIILGHLLSFLATGDQIPANFWDPIAISQIPSLFSWFFLHYRQCLESVLLFPALQPSTAFMIPFNFPCFSSDHPPNLLFFERAADLQHWVGLSLRHLLQHLCLSVFAHLQVIRIKHCRPSSSAPPDVDTRPVAVPTDGSSQCRSASRSMTLNASISVDSRSISSVWKTTTKSSLPERSPRL